MLDDWLDSYFMAPPATPATIATQLPAISCNRTLPYGPGNKTRSCAWAMATGASIPWFGAVGDKLALFPLAYLERYHRTGQQRDGQVATATVANYILPYPHRLPDGTFSRQGGCCQPPRSSLPAPYLWVRILLDYC